MLSFCSRLALGGVVAAFIALAPQLARAQAAAGVTYTSLYSFRSGFNNGENPEDALV